MARPKPKSRRRKPETEKADHHHQEEDDPNPSRCFICDQLIKPESSYLNQKDNSNPNHEFDKLERNLEVCQKFCTLASRFLNFNCKDKDTESSSSVGSGGFKPRKTLKIKSDADFTLDMEQQICDGCFHWAQLFCGLYGNWTKLKLQLIHTVKEMAGLMKKIKSEENRDHDLNLSDSSSRLKMLYFRDKFLEQVEVKSRSDYPRLKLKRLAKALEQDDDDDLFVAVVVKKRKTPKKPLAFAEIGKVHPKVTTVSVATETEESFLGKQKKNAHAQTDLQLHTDPRINLTKISVPPKYLKRDASSSSGTGAIKHKTVSETPRPLRSRIRSRSIHTQTPSAVAFAATTTENSVKDEKTTNCKSNATAAKVSTSKNYLKKNGNGTVNIKAKQILKLNHKDSKMDTPQIKPKKRRRRRRKIYFTDRRRFLRPISRSQHKSTKTQKHDHGQNMETDTEKSSSIMPTKRSRIVTKRYVDSVTDFRKLQSDSEDNQDNGDVAAKSKFLFKCRFCEKRFKSWHSSKIHQGRMHKKIWNAFSRRQKNLLHLNELTPTPTVSTTTATASSNAAGFPPTENVVQSATAKFAVSRAVTEMIKGGIIGNINKNPEKKPFACRFCDKRFKIKFNRKAHEMIHTNDTNDRSNSDNACRFCNKRFSHKHNRITHELIHNGLKPYNCELCTKTFRQLSHLKKHLATFHSLDDAEVTRLTMKQKQMVSSIKEKSEGEITKVKSKLRAKLLEKKKNANDGGGGCENEPRSLSSLIMNFTPAATSVTASPLFPLPLWPLPIITATPPTPAPLPPDTSLSMSYPPPATSIATATTATATTANSASLLSSHGSHYDNYNSHETGIIFGTNVKYEQGNAIRTAVAGTADVSGRNATASFILPSIDTNFNGFVEEEMDLD